MIDYTAELRTWLLTEATVTAQVSTRIWCSPGLSETEADDMPRKCLVILAGPGPGADRYVPTSVGNAQFRCYGATLPEAWAVYQALYAVLQRAHHERPATGKLLLTVHELAHPIDALEPETEWPVVLVTYQVRYVTDTVTT